MSFSGTIVISHNPVTSWERYSRTFDPGGFSGFHPETRAQGGYYRCRLNFLMKSANGQPPWVIVESISTTVTASKDPREIAQAVGDFAKSIARRDNVINEVLAQAKALLEGAVVEL